MMDELTEFLLEFISAEDNPVGLAIIAASAMVEYVIPPFPGDTITLFGAILITGYGWSFWAVFGAVMTGSVAGSMLAFYIGTWLQTRRDRRRAVAEAADQGDDARGEAPGGEAAGDQGEQTGGDEADEQGDEAGGEQAGDRGALLDRLVRGFERHGAAYLVISRFLPGVRAVFFVAAGMAGMRPAPVLAYSAISAALWNLGLIALGSLLGANLDALVALVRQYTIVVWIVLCTVCALFVLRALHRRRRAKQRDRTASQRDRTASQG